MPFTAAEIARQLGGEIAGDGFVTLAGFAATDLAKPGDLTFAENETYLARAEQSAASAILVPKEVTHGSKTLIRVANPRVAFARVLPLFFPEPVFAPGVHPTAVVAASAQIDPTAHIGPGCVVGERVQLGPRVVLQGLVYVGDDARLGEDARIFPNVTIYPRTQIGRRVRLQAGAVVGADGFGYVFDQGRHLKVSQVGNVIIEDDVEIGANVTIDRGALGPTIVGRGTKIDNLVQIGHNVRTGRHCIIVSQTGIAGSTKLGDHVTMAGQVGVAGHLKIGNNVTLSAKAGVMTDVPDDSKWLGAPARPDREMKRIYIALERLPDLLRRVKELEKKIEPADTSVPG